MEELDSKYSTIHYNSYLELDKLLSAQNLRSSEVSDEPAHEEMLFIIVHQAYELWFKQIIHELRSVLKLFDADNVHERNMFICISRLERVIEIQKLLIQQIDIIETMTPLDFLDFRNFLFPASGFQSFQFRMIENMLGLEEDKRMTYNGCPYFSVFSQEKQAKLKKSTDSSSLFEAMEAWLERTPFLKMKNFDFIDQYTQAVNRMISKEKVAIENTAFLNDNEKEMRLEMLGSTDTYFKTVLDKEHHLQMQKEGKIRLSYEATLAALLINLYRDEPLLHLPFRLLTCAIEMDDALTTWRYRHAQMVKRMLGNKIGTGGSSGHAYLSATAQKHPIFNDLHNISTLLIPRSELPKLPNELKQELGFYYSHICETNHD